jgi:TupA-like ATPgrasp
VPFDGGYPQCVKIQRPRVGKVVYYLPAGIERRVLFAMVHGRVPHFGRPDTFSEKINWRILNDRRPLIEWTCDKLAMKDYVLRESPAGLHVPRTIWSGSDPRDLETAELPEHWVLKPNHRSGLIYFGTGRPACRELSAVTATWLRRFEARRLREWAYSKARAVLFVEELMGEPGTPPSDYKFYVFDGKVAVVEMHIDRYAGHKTRLYTPDWSPLNVSCEEAALAPVAPPPPSLDQMLSIAARLGSPFDFMRVDLYNLDGTIAFGEFTPYPLGGLGRFTPTSFDIELGKAWTLPEL